MAKNQTRKVALLSIHPEYADRILDGSKTIEFRKRPLSPDITHVLIYATRPVGALVGVFEVRDQVRGAPNSIWRRFRLRGGVAKSAFDSYFEASAVAYGIVVQDVMPFVEPLPLSSLDPSMKPPQSVAYLRHDAVGRLKSLQRQHSTRTRVTRKHKSTSVRVAS